MKPTIADLPANERIELLLLDVDGVLTDGKLYFGAAGLACKAFHVRDGMGIAMLRRAGIPTGLVSGRAEDYVAKRADELGMRYVKLGVEDKGAVVAAILAESGVPSERVAFVGDDVNDIPAFGLVGVSIAVRDAHPSALQAARFVTNLAGGCGAVREVADLVLSRIASTRQ